ncbi:MAG: ABC transporter permease [Clostridiales bacterium]|nr:ABC transporter permease [Clostridiales bacterium]
MLFYGTTVDGLKMGLCFAVLALGVYISYSILDFPDLSVDGIFPLGGVLSTILMLKLGFHPVLAVLLTFFAGAVAGALTGVLHVRFKITKLLAGIIVMTGFLSINLALTKFLTKTGYTTTIFSFKSEGLDGLFGGNFLSGFSRNVRNYIIIAILLLFVIAGKILLDLFFKTKLGYMLRATGENEKIVTSLGRDPGRYKILGLAIADGLVAVSGALYSQLYSSYDNNSGTGKVVLALAAVIIGMALFSGARRVKDTTAVIIGAVIYSLCLNYLVLVDRDGIYLKLLNAVMFALILIFNDKLTALNHRRRTVKGITAKSEEITAGGEGDA